MTEICCKVVQHFKNRKCFWTAFENEIHGKGNIIKLRLLKMMKEERRNREKKGDEKGEAAAAEMVHTKSSCFLLLYIHILTFQIISFNTLDTAEL